MEHPKHEVNCFLSVQKRIEKILEKASWFQDPGIPIVAESKLGNLITDLSCTQAATFTATHGDLYGGPIANLRILVDGDDVGTLGNPNIDEILEKSKASPFGRGEDTVLDSNYRNGREIEESRIVLGEGRSESQKKALFRSIEDQVAEALFLGRFAQLSLYKLAIYGKDGHFNWHRDTTHADNHHGTVLVALNTKWTGGGFDLKHDDKTISIDMHTVRCHEKIAKFRDSNEDSDDDASQTSQDDDKSMQGPPEDLHIGFKFVAFYTDMEHKVEPVTDGDRLVLQFDVQVYEDDGSYADDSQTLIKGAHTYGNAVSDDFEPLFANIDDTSPHKTLQKIIQEIAQLHAASKPVFPVVLPLRHLYRWASLAEDHLKGVDSILHAKLTETYKVGLAPVLVHKTDDDMEHLAWCYPLPSKYERAAHRDALSLKAMRKAQMYLPARYQLALISEKGFIEYTGNEAQIGEARYYGGAMFISPGGSGK